MPASPYLLALEVNAALIVCMCGHVVTLNSTWGIKKTVSFAAGEKGSVL